MLSSAMLPIAVGLAPPANPTAFWRRDLFARDGAECFSHPRCLLPKASRAWRSGSGFRCSDGGSTFSRRTYISQSYSASASFSFGTAYDQNVTPVTALIRNLFDTLQLNRATFPKSVGEKIQVQWGAGSYYYPSTVTEIKENQYKIRYDSDPQGIYDEWVGMNRIKSGGLDPIRQDRRDALDVALWLVGGVIAVYFVATRNSS